jgi:hypothetical protein
MRTMEKVWMAAFHLESVTVEWYYAIEQDHSVLSWPCFSDFVNLWFGPPLRTNIMAELKDFHRMGPVRNITLTLIEREDNTRS